MFTMLSHGSEVSRVPPIDMLQTQCLYCSGQSHDSDTQPALSVVHITHHQLCQPAQDGEGVQLVGAVCHLDAQFGEIRHRREIDVTELKIVQVNIAQLYQHCLFKVVEIFPSSQTGDAWHQLKKLHQSCRCYTATNQR